MIEVNKNKLTVMLFFFFLRLLSQHRSEAVYCLTQLVGYPAPLAFFAAAAVISLEERQAVVVNSDAEVVHIMPCLATTRAAPSTRRF